MDLRGLVHALGLRDSDILNVYLNGSRIFGTWTEKSDWDFTVIVTNTCKDIAERWSEDMIDANIFSEKRFMQLIQEHDMRALICVFLPARYVWKCTIDFGKNFHLDSNSLRAPVSSTSNKAYACGKIQIEKEGDIRKGKKNIVQAMRYALFGIQMLEHGRIVDYERATDFHKQIFDDPSCDWAHIDKTYGSQVEKVARMFRQHFGEWQRSETRQKRRSRKSRPSAGVLRYQHLGTLTNDLPENVIERILSFVTCTNHHTGLGQFAAVCKKWKKALLSMPHSVLPARTRNEQ